MNARAIIPSRALFASLLLAVLLGACTGKGPDIADPATGARSQASILALDADGGSELAIVQEPDGIVSTTAFVDANSSPLGRRIDGIFESFDRLFLLHRATSSITIVDLASRQKLSEITGFSDSASALCGVAFSNLSQGWAIDYNQPFVFHVDAVNSVVVDTLAIEGRPTSVATMGSNVFVASQLPDGSALVSVFRSNFSAFQIEHRLSFPTPIVFMSTNGNGDAMILLSAGSPGGKPIVYSVRGTVPQQTGDAVLNVPALIDRIGTVPEYATISRDNYLYVATQDYIYRLDVASSRLSAQPQKWIDGAFEVIGVDFWTDLLYAYDRPGGALRRFDRDGEAIESLPITAPVSAIEFVNPNRMK